MIYKVSIPFDAADEIQDYFTAFYQFLNNYGSTAWSRVVETYEGDEYQTTLEIMSTEKEEVEKIEVGVVRGMERWMEENPTEWTWTIEELHTLE